MTHDRAGFSATGRTVTAPPRQRMVIHSGFDGMDRTGLEGLTEDEDAQEEWENADSDMK